VVPLFRHEVLDVNEPVADCDKWQRSFALPKPVYDEPSLADPHGKPYEVAVAGNQAEPVKMLRVQQVHGVDNHGRVRRVLALSIGKLLHGLDGQFEKRALPSIQASTGPIAVGPLDAYGPISGDLREQGPDPCVLRVVRINENGELARRGGCIICHLVCS